MKRTAWPTSLWLVLFVVASGCLGDLGVGGAPSAVHQFLRADPYPKLLVEVDYVEGKAPRGSAVALLEQRIFERLSKPGGTTVVSTALGSSRSTYSVADLVALEAQHRQNVPGGDRMVLYVLYLNGQSDQDTNEGKVLGVQYGPTSIALFKESIDSSTFLGLGFGGEDLEKSVLVHEFGHAVGLVNNGVPMGTDHEDDAHPKHSTNPESVMYWAVENTLGLPLLSQAPPTQFDESDVADLRAAGGK